MPRDRDGAGERVPVRHEVHDTSRAFANLVDFVQPAMPSPATTLARLVERRFSVAPEAAEGAGQNRTVHMKGEPSILRFGSTAITRCPLSSLPVLSSAKNTRSP